MTGSPVEVTRGDYKYKEQILGLLLQVTLIHLEEEGLAGDGFCIALRVRVLDPTADFSKRYLREFVSDIRFDGMR